MCRFRERERDLLIRILAEVERASARNLNPTTQPVIDEDPSRAGI